MPLFIYLLRLGQVSSESGRIEHPFLTMFMQHPDFNVNGQIMPVGDSHWQTFVTPLYVAAIEFARLLTAQFVERTFRMTYQGAQILPSAGADPNLDLSLPGALSPVANLRRTKDFAQRGDRDYSAEVYEANERYWDEVLTLFEKY